VNLQISFIEDGGAETGGANHLRLTLNANRIPAFFPVLQRGFLLNVRVGCSIRSFLRDQLGLTAEYVEQKVQTLFIDGKPVDDLDRTVVRDGSTLALSSAMPGLLGAALRRGGRYAPMRSQMTYEEGEKTVEVKNGQITVKLFNLTLGEMGSLFLERGIGIAAEDLTDCLRKQSGHFWNGCCGVSVDGENIECGRLPNFEWTTGLVYLQVETI
jgi:hypothetical protein